MSDGEQQSLLTIEDELGMLPGGDLSRVINRGEESGRYTAGRLQSQRPEIYRAARALIRAGLGLQEVASELNLHFYTVQSVAAQDVDAVAVGKKHTARLAGHVGRRALERVADYLEAHTIQTAGDAQRLATVAGIAIDKAQLLDGEPTAIHATSGPSLIDASALLRDLLPRSVTAADGSDQKGEFEAAAVVAGGGQVAAARWRRAQVLPDSASGVNIAGSGLGKPTGAGNAAFSRDLSRFDGITEAIEADYKPGAGEAGAAAGAGEAGAAAGAGEAAGSDKGGRGGPAKFARSYPINESEA